MANVPISGFTVPANTIGIGATGYSLTGSASASFVDLAGTWNTTGTPTLIKANVTDTASNAASLLMDLQVGGVSVFAVRKDNRIGIPSLSFIQFGNSQHIFLGSNASTVLGRFNSNGFTVPPTSTIGFTDGTPDLILGRRAAANLRLGAADAAAPVAQTLSVQGVVAGTTNTAGANLTINGSQGTGTGAGGSIVFQVAPAGSSGTAQNALATALTISSNDVIVNTVGNRFFIVSDKTGETAGANIQGTTGSISTVSGAVVQWTNSATNSFGTPDTILRRDAANTLALRNGTNAQTFNVYNTFTDASNYERGFLKWSSNILQIGAEAAGSGTLRNVQIPITDNGNLLIIGGTTSGTTFGVDEDGSLLVRRQNSSAFGLSMGSRGGGTIHTLTLGASTRLAFSSVNQPDGDSTIDVGLVRLTAGIIGVVDGSTGGASIEFTEQTAPAAPAANGVRIYAVDNGSGKTQLMALFATGAAQQIAIEP
jgi:hypothetical protein